MPRRGGSERDLPVDHEADGGGRPNAGQESNARRESKAGREPAAAREPDGSARPELDRLGRPVGVTPPRDVARAAMNRAKAAARAKGLRPGQPTRRSRPETSLSGAGPGARDPELLGDALGRLVRDRGWSTDVSVGSVMSRWPEIVGPQTAQHCVPETFENKTLVIRADSTAWATNMRLLLPRLMERLAQEVGEGVVETVTVLGPAGPSFGRGRKRVRGPGPRDTWG